MAVTRRAQMSDLARVRLPSQAAISPDGSAVVYALRTVDTGADAARSALWRVGTDGAAPTPLTVGTDDTSPAWSPDGSRVAFLRRSAAGGPAQVWLTPAGAGEPRQLTELPHGAGAPVWSPDGSQIAVAAPVALGPLDADAPIVTDRLRYKRDGQGWLRGKRTHVFVIDVADGRTRQVTEGEWDAGAPAWSPDGQRLAFPATTAPDADLTRESEAYVLDLTSGERRAVLRGSVGPVMWSPDGGALVVVGAPEVRIGHERLLRAPVDGGPGFTELAADLDRNIMTGANGYPGGLPQFTGAGGTLLFCAREHGCTQLYALDGDLTGAARPVVAGGGRVVSALSVARAAPRAAVVVAAPGSFEEVAVVDLETGELTVLTDHSLPDVALYEPEERWFTAPDGTRVHGWLLRDPAARTPAPLLLDIHGGPHNAWSPPPSPGRFYWQLLAARGWAVLLLNPRGSDGYGEQYFTAAVGGWGLADEQDFLGAVDQLVDEGTADPRRLAVAGYSYGGFMTCWLTGRTDRFAAAVVGGPVADTTSMIGTSDAGYTLAQFETRALPWQDPERAAAQSPYQRVGEVTTPTLLLQGAADDRCPPGQAEQWFAALRARGVPTRLVLYPGASHLFLYSGRPSHQADYSRRLVDWVTRHTGTVPSLAGDRWQRRLTELADRFRVPGAVLGVLRGDERAVVAAGVTNVDTGVTVTPDTRFQIGSITKTWTTTAALRLVEQGRLDLDKPVVSYLPELRLADPEAAGQITLRHLLTHTSGIDGDVFRDTGRGDDSLQRYVAGLADVAQVHPPGATLSYCNAGFAIVGRLIEVVTGRVWDDAMRELLFAPLGMDGVALLPEEAMLHRVAVGHVHEADEPMRRTEVWSLPRATAAFGGTPCATADDLLTFAQAHLDPRVLPAETVAAMQAAQVPLPGRYSAADSWGLGWFRSAAGGTRLVGHDGGTLGQFAFLRLLPDHDLALVLLTNGGFAPDLYATLFREVVEELTGVSLPDPVAPPAGATPVDAGRYAGSYRRTGVRYEVTGSRLRIMPERQVPGLEPPPRELDLLPVDPSAGGYAVRAPGAQMWSPITFYDLPGGASYLHFGYRATPKVD